MSSAADTLVSKAKNSSRVICDKSVQQNVWCRSASTLIRKRACQQLVWEVTDTCGLISNMTSDNSTCTQTCTQTILGPRVHVSNKFLESKYVNTSCTLACEHNAVKCFVSVVFLARHRSDWSTFSMPNESLCSAYRKRRVNHVI